MICQLILKICWLQQELKNRQVDYFSIKLFNKNLDGSYAISSLNVSDSSVNRSMKAVLVSDIIPCQSENATLSF